MGKIVISSQTYRDLHHIEVFRRLCHSLPITPRPIPSRQATYDPTLIPRAGGRKPELDLALAAPSPLVVEDVSGRDRRTGSAIDLPRPGDR